MSLNVEKAKPTTALARWSYTNRFAKLEVRGGNPL